MRSMRETLIGFSLALIALGFFVGTPVASAGTRVASCTTAEKIFYGGPVITMNSNQMEARAVAVCGDGTIAAVGDEKSVMTMKGPKTELVNLKERTLLPGFVEPHTHLGLTVQSQLSIPCGDQSKPSLPITEVYDRLKAEVKRLEQLKIADPWVVGAEFDPSRSSPLFASMDAASLDERVSSTIPVFVLNASGHIAYVNTKALEKAGIPKLHDDVGVVKDATGTPTGQLNEVNAINLVFKKIPPSPEKLFHDTAVQVIQQWAAAGVTTSTEISLGLTIGVDADLKLYQGLAKDHQGPIRFRVYLDYNQVTLDYGQVRPVDPRFKVKDYKQLKDNQGDEWLEFLGVKFVTDGSTQGCTAALTEPYQNNCGGTNPSFGTFNFPPEGPTLTDIMRPFYKAGWQLAAHANGDRAIDQVLHAYEDLRKEDPNLPERRLRIEHFTVTNSTPAQLDQILSRVQVLGVIPGMTAGHLYFWGQVLYTPILGPERAKIHPSQSLKAKKIRFAYHSDSPVTKVEPLRYVQTEVTRAPQSVPPNTLGAEEAITVDEALRAVTLDAAYQIFFDQKVGSLEVNKLADFVVLDRNPRAVDPSTIASIRVLETYLGGRKVYPQ